MERLRKISWTLTGLLLALTVLTMSFISPYLLNGRVGPFGFPWVFTSAVISQFLVLIVCIYVAAFMWRTRGEDGR